MKKILLLGIALILLSSFVYSAEVAFYPFTSDYTDGVGVNDGTNQGTARVTRYPPFDVSGSGTTHGVEFDRSATEYMTAGSDSSLSFTDGNDLPFSINIWVNMTDASTARLFSKISNPLWEYLLTTTGTDFLQLFIYESDGVNRIGQRTDAAITFLEGKYMMLTATYDGSETDGGIKLYMNGTLLPSSASNNGVYTGMSETAAVVNIGRYQPGPDYYDGDMDHIMVFDIELTTDQINNLYDYGNITAPPPPSTEFVLSLTNFFDLTSINEFTANFTNSSATTQIATTNGTIRYREDQLVNISVFNVSSGTFFNQTVQNKNTSTNETVFTHQAVLIIDAKEKISNNDIGVFNASVIQGINSQFNTSNNSYYTTFYVNSGSYNITGITENHTYNASTTVSLSTLQTENIIINFSNYRLNVSNQDYFTNTVINSFTINVNFNNSEHLENISTTNGVAQFYGLNRTYNITVFNDDYADQSASISLENVSQSYNFTLFTTNSVYFRFYDEVDHFLLDMITINVDLISDAHSTNGTTTNGTLYIDLLTPSSYSFRTTATDFAESFYEYTVTNDSNIQIDIYLLNTSTTGYINVTAIVYDEDRVPVESAFINVLRYDIITNTYLVTEIVVTNFEGVAVLNLVQYEEYYKFLIEYDGVQRLLTEKTRIYTDSLTFQIILGEIIGGLFFNTEDVASQMIFNNVTNNFRFTFSDPKDSVTRGCMLVYSMTWNERTLLNTTCASGTSGITYSPITPVNGTSYEALGYVYFGDTERFVASKIISFSSTPSLGNMGWIGILILTIIFAMIGGWSIVVAVILTPLPLLAGSLLQIVPLGWEYALGIQIIAVIIALMIGKRG